MSISKPYSSVVIGLGQVGIGYDLKLDPDAYTYTHCRSISQHKDYELTCAIDASADRRNVFSEHYHKPAYQNIDSMLSNHNPDIVFIATPTNTHLEVMEEVVAKLRPAAVLCEKPLANTVDDAETLVSLCDTKDIVLCVNYMRRSIPGANEVRKRIEQGLIKTPLKGVVWYTKGFQHNGSHFFNLMEYWLGEYKNSKLIEEGNILSDDSEPTVNVEFRNGAILFIPANEEDYSHYTVELISPSGRLYWGQGKLTWQNVKEDPVLTGYKRLNITTEVIETGIERYQFHVLEQLSMLLNGYQSDICTGKQALDTLRNIRACVIAGLQ